MFIPPLVPVLSPQGIVFPKFSQRLCIGTKGEINIIICSVLSIGTKLSQRRKSFKPFFEAHKNVFVFVPD